MTDFENQQQEISVEPTKSGLYQPTKGDFPVRYGERGEVTTPELVLQFDRAGRIKHVMSHSRDWPHPLEYLKRSDGNDWIYYSLGEYSDYLGLYGEYYLPCPQYPTNRPLGGEPFRKETIRRVIRAWPKVIEEAIKTCSGRPPDQRQFLEGLAVNEPIALAQHAQKLHEIIGATLPVLPPDARHIDYDIVPLIVADGCRYGCSFCCVNDHRKLASRTKAQIEEQLLQLRIWLGGQAGNVNGLFLGLHDALSVDDELLAWAIERAYGVLGFASSPFSRPHLYLFSSADSILIKSDRFFEFLNEIPWSTYINVGLEAADGVTLKKLGKPLSPNKVAAAFQRMVDINARLPNVEVTANFVLLPDDDGRADDAMVSLINTHLARRSSRGVCYLSPLMKDPRRRPRANRRAMISRIHRLQRSAPLDLYLYLIQRF